MNSKMFRFTAFCITFIGVYILMFTTFVCSMYAFIPAPWMIKALFGCSIVTLLSLLAGLGTTDEEIDEEEDDTPEDEFEDDDE